MHRLDSQAYSTCFLGRHTPREFVRQHAPDTQRIPVITHVSIQLVCTHTPSVQEPPLPMLLQALPAPCQRRSTSPSRHLDASRYVSSTVGPLPRRRVVRPTTGTSDRGAAAAREPTVARQARARHHGRNGAAQSQPCNRYATPMRESLRSYATLGHDDEDTTARAHTQCTTRRHCLVSARLRR